MERDRKAAFFDQLDLADDRAGRAVGFGLVERLLERLFGVAAELDEPLAQRFIQKSVASGIEVVFDLLVLVQLQVGQGTFDRHDTLVQRFDAFDGFLVCCAGHLVLRHAGNEHRLNGPGLKIGVKRRVQFQQILLRALAHPDGHLIPEMRPGGREAFLCPAVYRAGAIGQLEVFPLDPVIIPGNLLHHMLCGTGDHHSVHRVMQVAVGADLAQPPALAQVRGDASAECRDPLLSGCGMPGKFQMIPDVIQQKPRHVLGILQIALPEAVLLLLRKAFFQQVLPLFVAAHMGFCPYHEVVPFLSLQVLHGQAVAFLTVFGGQHQYLIAAGVIKADAVRDDVVDLRIPCLEQAADIQTLQRIGAPAVLLFPQPVLDKVLTGRLQHMEGLPDLFHQALVFGGVVFHGLFRLHPLVKGFAQLTRQLDVYKDGAFPHFPDDGIHDLDGLGNGTANHRAGDLLHFRRGGGQHPGLLFAAVATEIISGGGAGLVIGHALFQKRDQLVTGHRGNVPEPGEIQVQKRLDLACGQPQRKQCLLSGLFRTVAGQRLRDLIAQGAFHCVKTGAAQRFAQLMGAFQRGQLVLLFAVGRGLVRQVADIVESQFVRQSQRFADAGVVHFRSGACQSAHGFPFLLRQGAGRAVLHKTKVVDLL